jgi:hypothetical protein
VVCTSTTGVRELRGRGIGVARGDALVTRHSSSRVVESQSPPANIPTLSVLSFICGAPGALVECRQVRHMAPLLAALPSVDAGGFVRGEGAPLPPGRYQGVG